MMSPAAPCMATYRESRQKSAERIVSRTTEGPNVEMSGVSNELDVGVESDRMSQTPARHGIAFPRLRLGVSVVYIADRDLIFPIVIGTR